ncbi:MAG TPA: hypothetical protein VFZ23_09435 [Pyrinomonadaceae bacterium]
MALKSFESKIGMFIAGAYLLFSCVAIISIMMKPDPHGMSGLALMILAMPWSFILFDALGDVVPRLAIASISLYAFCLFLNAAILYLISLLFSLLIEWIARIAKTPQD